MDLAALVPWLSAAALIISVATSVTTFLTSGAKTTAKIVADHERRIQAIEGELKHLPDRKMVHDLQLTLKDIQIEMAGLRGETEQSTRISRRVEEFLLSQGSRAA